MHVTDGLEVAKQNSARKFQSFLRPGPPNKQKTEVQFLILHGLDAPPRTNIRLEVIVIYQTAPRPIVCTVDKLLLSARNIACSVSLVVSDAPL